MAVHMSPFIVLSDGRKILQCHSKGDKRFSPFFCEVDSFGKILSIENHYQATKVFKDKHTGDLLRVRRSGRSWRDAKSYQEIHSLDHFVLPNGMNLGKSKSKLSDLPIQYYVALWYKYLKTHPDLIEFAKSFDDFEGSCERNFPICQADVIRQCVQEGVHSLKPLFSQLITEIKNFGS